LGTKSKASCQPAKPASQGIAVDLRKQVNTKYHAKIEEQLETGAKNLPPIKAGDNVAIQDQSTPTKPGKWTKTGEVVKVIQFNSYMVGMHGSQAPTQQNS
jgi:DNA-directed RNA polymerase subunit H (RpoH/RPB5)